LLQKLAQSPNSRILITTRLYPSALQRPTGDPQPGCVAYFLRGLRDDDALALWRALNVSGSRNELAPIFRSVEAHPLLVQALASEVANYRRAPGDFARWRADHPNFDPASLPLVQSRTHILEFALSSLSPKIREVLHPLVGFRMLAGYATLEALLVGADKACASAPELDRALTELEDRGLIGWDRAANRYDAHPIVRGVVWSRTTTDDQRAVHSALEAYFEPMPTPEWENVETLADLTPAIERYYTLAGLGRYDDAIALFRDRLSRATLFRLAAHRERTALLERLFPNGTANLPALSTERDQSCRLNALALSYESSGEPGRSVPLYRRADDLDERAGDKRSRQITLSNLGDLLREIGSLREAAQLLRMALVLSREVEDEWRESVGLQFLGRLLSITGAHALGRVALGRGRHISVTQGDRQFEGIASAYLGELALKRGDPVKAGFWSECAWELAAARRHERDFIRAALLQGSVALVASELSRAEERLHHALTRARRQCRRIRAAGPDRDCRTRAEARRSGERQSQPRRCLGDGRARPVSPPPGRCLRGARRHRSGGGTQRSGDRRRDRGLQGGVVRRAALRLSLGAGESEGAARGARRARARPAAVR
jgi:tetratricopeptide (TPR) repeat protein